MKEYSVWVDETEKIVSFHEVDNSELIYFDQRRNISGLPQCADHAGLPVPVSLLAHAIYLKNSDYMEEKCSIT